MHELNERISKANFWCRVAEWTLAVVISIDMLVIGVAVGVCIKSI